MNIWVEQEKVALKQKLKKFLNNYPQYMNEFIQICTDSLTEFRQRCREDVDQTARLAIEQLLQSISPTEQGGIEFNNLPDDTKIGRLIRGMRIHFPKGVNSIGMPQDKAIFDLFIDLLNKQNFINRFEDFLKHNGHYEWIIMVQEQIRDTANK